MVCLVLLRAFQQIDHAGFVLVIRKSFRYISIDFTLRDKNTHDGHVNESISNGAAMTVSGVMKRGSILNSLRFFHVTSNTAPDIMHDLLEGVIPMEVKLVLHRFIYEDHFFTLHDINVLMSSHNFGHCDNNKKNFPAYGIYP